MAGGVRGRFDLDTLKGAQVHRLVKDKRLAQLSRAFDVLDRAKVTLADGESANEFRELRVYEFSFVPIAANRSTIVETAKTPRGQRRIQPAELAMRLRLAALRL